MFRGRLKNILRKVGNPSYMWNSPRFEPEEYIKKCRKLFTLNNIIKSGRKSILHIGHLVPNSLVIHAKILFEV